MGYAFCSLLVPVLFSWSTHFLNCSAHCWKQHSKCDPALEQKNYFTCLKVYIPAQTPQYNICLFKNKYDTVGP